MAKDRFRANRQRDLVKKNGSYKTGEGRVFKNYSKAKKMVFKKSYENYKNNMRVIKANFDKLNKYELTIVEMSLNDGQWKKLYYKIRDIAKRVGGRFYT
jgi:hypothetical protein